MPGHDEDMADQMSLDGSDTSDSDDSDDMDLENDLDDQTDEEDWSAIGPEALRASSSSHRMEYRDYNYLSRTEGARYRSPSAQPASLSHAGRTTAPAFHPSFASRFNTGNNSAFASSLGALGNQQEREAVAALVAMGSM
jgi:hypothetical protein